ncbi:MAG: NAD(P)H-dependent oxidoreductase [Armatimonadetes bacterium]|nr:NAD(P)H-dependent oxidoreductase [Armatimonadota bacterium]
MTVKVLLVWYSRSGNTTKAMQTLAEHLRGEGAEVSLEQLEEVGTNRRGVTGWLRAGRDATLKREVEIAPVEADVSSFDLVVLGTPVWASTMAPAVRTFCSAHGHEIERVAFLCTFGGGGDVSTFRNMAATCGGEPVATLALIDKRIRKDDEDGFLRPVAAFARECVAAVEA